MKPSVHLENVRNGHPASFDFEVGDVYLFHATDPACPAKGSLWGVFDRRNGDTVYLESSTVDFRHLCTRHRLPRRYRYCRLSSPAELRDYMSMLVRFDIETMRTMRPERLFNR